MQRRPFPASLQSLSDGRYVVCITSFLAAFVRVFAPIVGLRTAKSFLEYAGKNIEVFLPFYSWHDREGKIRPVTFEAFGLLERLYGMKGIRAVHAGYPGEGLLFARHFLNIAYPPAHEQNILRVRSEISFIQTLREKLNISHPVLYVLHCGRIERNIGMEESFQSTVSLIRRVMEDAERAGVCIAIENIYSRGHEQIGTSLGQIGDILDQVGTEWVDRGVLGWTFDPSHALIVYKGDYGAIERDLKPILPSCVHLHINHPRTSQDSSGQVLSEWSRGDDYHAAPVRIPNREQFWKLLATTILGSKIRKWKTMTYEVNLGIPFLRPIFGGSPLSEVVIGLDAVDRFCNHPTESFDVQAICRYIDGRLAEGKDAPVIPSGKPVKVKN